MDSLSEHQGNSSSESEFAALRSVLQECLTDDLAELPDDQLGQEIVDLHAVRSMLDAVELRRVGEWDARQAWAEDGAPTGGTWLAHRCHLPHSTARERVRVARQLRTMPRTFEAFAAGEIDYSHVRVLAQAAGDRHTAEHFPEAEDHLVRIAKQVSAEVLRRAVKYWRWRVEPDTETIDDRDLFEGRKAWCSETFQGMVRMDANFDPEGGAIAKSTIEAYEELLWRSETSGDAAASPDERRTPAQRRADALVQIFKVAQDALNHPDSTHRAVPLIAAVIDYDKLLDRAGRPGYLHSREPVTGDALRRLLCDAEVARVIRRGRSEVLDLGRASRTATTALRRALALRDRGCAWAGCSAPVSWCDAHHIWHWIDGGPTDRHNMVLLCFHHHHLVHDRGFEIRGDPEAGTLMFHRPDGSLIDAAPLPIAA